MKTNLIRYSSSYILALVLAWSSLLQGCGQTDVIAAGVVYDATTGIPLDSVLVVQYWIERDDERILNTSYSDSLGQFLNWDYIRCRTKQCRFMVVFSKNGFRSQAINNDDGPSDMDVRMVPD